MWRARTFLVDRRGENNGRHHHRRAMEASVADPLTHPGTRPCGSTARQKLEVFWPAENAIKACRARRRGNNSTVQNGSRPRGPDAPFAGWLKPLPSPAIRAPEENAETGPQGHVRPPLLPRDACWEKKRPRDFAQDNSRDGKARSETSAGTSAPGRRPSGD